jgi:hypothetical protein
MSCSKNAQSDEDNCTIFDARFDTSKLETGKKRLLLVITNVTKDMEGLYDLYLNFRNGLGSIIQQCNFIIIGKIMVYAFIFVSFCVSISLYTYLSVCMYVNLTVCLSDCRSPFVCLSVCLSI